MKKLLVVVLLLLNCCYAANWVQFFEKTYVDMDSLGYDKNGNIAFWTKNLRKDPKDKYNNKDFAI